MSSSAPLKRPGEDDIASEAAPPKKARTTAPTPSASPPSTTNAHPATPPQAFLPGLGMNGGGGSVTFPTPPSTAGFHNHMVGPGSVDSGGNDSEQQTPAGEVMDGVSKTEEGEGIAIADTEKMEDVEQTTSEHRRTDHEREGGETKPLPTVAPPGSSTKVEVPRLYKLPTSPLPPLEVPLATNLLSLYSLTTLQSTVARRDPVTGEKINPLRKHYGNKVKSLGLEGRDKPLKRPGELFGLVDPGWDMVVDGTRNLWQVQREDAPLESEGDVEGALGKLESALGGITVGQLPRKEHEEWRSLLGLDDAATTAAAPLANAPSRPVLPASTTRPTPHAPASAVPAHLSRTAPAAAARSSAPASPSRLANARPERTGKKRRYDDASFEGYEEDGHSTAGGGAGDDGGGGRRGSMGKRVKVAASGSGSSSATGGGGGTMVGVRSS